MNLGVAGLLAANTNLDLLGLGFGLLGEANLQQALVIAGVHLPCIHDIGEGVVFDADINVFFVNARDFELINSSLGMWFSLSLAVQR